MAYKFQSGGYIASGSLYQKGGDISLSNEHNMERDVAILGSKQAQSSTDKAGQLTLNSAGVGILKLDAGISSNDPDRGLKLYSNSTDKAVELNVNTGRGEVVVQDSGGKLGDLTGDTEGGLFKLRFAHEARENALKAYIYQDNGERIGALQTFVSGVTAPVALVKIGGFAAPSDDAGFATGSISIMDKDANMSVATLQRFQNGASLSFKKDDGATQVLAEAGDDDAFVSVYKADGTRWQSRMSRNADGGLFALSDDAGQEVFYGYASPQGGGLELNQINGTTVVQLDALTSGGRLKLSDESGETMVLSDVVDGGTKEFGQLKLYKSSDGVDQRLWLEFGAQAGDDTDIYSGSISMRDPLDGHDAVELAINAKAAQFHIKNTSQNTVVKLEGSAQDSAGRLELYASGGGSYNFQALGQSGDLTAKGTNILFTGIADIGAGSNLASGDKITFQDADASSVLKTVTLTNYADFLAGAGVTATNGVLSVSGAPIGVNVWMAADTQNLIASEGLNVWAQSLTASADVKLPKSLAIGEQVIIKMNGTNFGEFNASITAEGSTNPTIDGTGDAVVLESPMAALRFIKVDGASGAEDSKWTLV